MSYTFRLIFEGVCAFVPDAPFFIGDKPQQPSKMSVLIPDLRRAAERTTGMRDAHFPAIIFNLENLDRLNSDRFVDLIFREDNSQKECGLCVLRKEVIKVDSTAGRPEKFQFASTVPNPPSNFPRTVAEAMSVYWLPPIVELHQNGTELAASDLDPDRFTLFPPQLIGAVQVCRGFFRCVNFNREESGDPIIWRFAGLNDPGQGKWNRVIGNRWAVEIYDLNDPITLTLEGRAIDPQTTQLTFSPKLNEALVEVEISNLEPDQIFADSGLDIVGSPDPDFEEFYHQISSQNAPSNPLVPNLGRGQIGLGTVRKPCAQAAFNGFA